MKTFIFWMLIIVLWSPIAFGVELRSALTIGGELGGESQDTFGGKLKHKMPSGAGINMNYGLALTVSPTYPHAFESRLTIGGIYLPRGDDEDGSTTWTSIPLEFKYFYDNKRNRFKLGYGLSYRMATSSESTGPGFNSDVRFKNSLGYLFALEKYIEPSDTGVSMSYGIRYTIIDYKEASSGTTFNGNSFGFYIEILGVRSLP